jgi:hypothetical protein
MVLIPAKISDIKIQSTKKRKLSRGPEVLDHDFLVFRHPKGDWLDRVLKCSSYSPIRGVAKEPTIKEEMLAPACSVGCAILH